MINKVLTYLHSYYGDRDFHDMTPFLNEHMPTITEDDIYNLERDGLVETQTRPLDLTESDETHPLYARLTDQGLYYLMGNRRIASVIEAINEQLVLNLVYKKGKDKHTEQVKLEPYIYGKDTEGRPVVWGYLPEEDKVHRYLIDEVEISGEPVGRFNVNREMQLRQPRDIDVVAHVRY